ncbi:MAG TPA: xanthine dehydrogenase small subunit, partial [Rhizomicrobium sp.]
MRDTVRFQLDGRLHEIQNPDPTRTVLRWLRSEARRTGTKEGCAEGDCGACTVVLGEERESKTVYRAVNACILFLPMLDGKTLFTVESLSAPGTPLHPVQQAMVDTNASQCGFCTPGFVMSLYAHYLNGGATDAPSVRNALAGNLCRCTGYGPIVEAAQRMNDAPRAAPKAQATLADGESLALASAGRRFFAPRTISELASLVLAHPDATVLGGATDVGLWVTKKLQVLPTVISVMSVAELSRIAETPDVLEIGAAVTYSAAQTVLARLHPDLGELIRRLGSVQVRNAGTIGGNIANGSPIGDSPPPLIALGATLVLRRGDTQRRMPLEDFFLAYGKQDRRPGEFVEKVIVSKLKPGADFRVYKISKRFD